MKKILLSLLALGCFSAANAQTFRFGPTVGGNLNISDETKTKIGFAVGAKAEIYQLINNLAKQGMAIIVVSSELPEVIGISDRIVTFCEGELTGEYLQEEATQEKLLQSATK